MENRFFEKNIHIENSNTRFVNKMEQNLYWVSTIKYLIDPYTRFTLLVSDENLKVHTTYSFKLPNANKEILSVRYILECSNGGIVIIGTVGVYPHQKNSLFMLRLNSNGDKIWSKEVDVVIANFKIDSQTISAIEFSPSLLLISTGRLLFTINNKGELINKVSIASHSKTHLKVEIVKIASTKVFISISLFTQPNIFLILSDQLKILQYISYKGDDFFKEVKFTKVDDELYFLSKSNKHDSKKHLFSFNPSLGIPKTIQTKVFVEYQDISNYEAIYTVGNHITRISRITSGKTVIRNFTKSLESIDSKATTEKIYFATTTSDNAAIYTRGEFLGIKIPESLTNTSYMSFDTIPNVPLGTETFTDGFFNIPFQPTPEVQIRVFDIEPTTPYHFEVIKICPVTLSSANSTITATPIKTDVNGKHQSKVTVKLMDEDGDPIQLENYRITMRSTSGEITFPTQLSKSVFESTIILDKKRISPIVSFTVNGKIFPNTVFIDFPFEIPMTPVVHIQSPHLYLQAAGSAEGDGDQSTPGIHLRWSFKNKLGNEHVPKGNLAIGTANYNKPDDYVRVYRAPYRNISVTISLEDAPQYMNHEHAHWVYTIDNSNYYVIFRDRQKYNSALQVINLEEGNRLAFLELYDDGIFEVETRSLAFGVKWITNHQLTNSSLQTELRSVETNALSADKNVIARKTFTGNALNDTQQFGDTIRSVRFRAINCYVTTIHLELYQTFLQTTNTSKDWSLLGDFALTTSDEEALQRLENIPGSVHEKWPRYTNNNLVNSYNYWDKWNGKRKKGDRNLKQVVEKYIELSNQEGNPLAEEIIDFSNALTSNGVSDLQEVSNLNILQLAATDYHIARMMGLGHIDTAIDSGVQKYVYMMEYHTQAYLENSPTIERNDLLNTQEVQHFYMTIPTSKQDTRLPYPVDLLSVEPGVKSIGLDQNSALTDLGGYTAIGRQQYLSIYAKELIAYENESFYETSTQFNYSEATYPVYAGISYREKTNENNWVDSEISSNAHYFSAGSKTTSEVIPLPIPLSREPLFIHRILRGGIHAYLGYGINWFGRSNISKNEPLEIITEFPVQQSLKPPVIISALHIIEEDQTILTSVNEQERFKTNTFNDPTIVRLLFNYNQDQELISYPVHSDDRRQFTELQLLHPTIYKPNQNEVFANEIEVFFRNRLPQSIRGRISTITNDITDSSLFILTTDQHILYSKKNKNEVTGEYEYAAITPEIPEGISVIHFTGGVLMIGMQKFIIHSMSVDTNGFPVIKIYKNSIQEVQPMTMTGTPDISRNEQFIAIENMTAIESWGSENPSTFKIQIPKEICKIHRALIETSVGSGTNELVLEKFRGLYDTNVTITPVLETNEINDSHKEIASMHKGLYKIHMSKTLSQHPQFNEKGNSVEWQGGTVRIPSEANPRGFKRVLRVLKIENIGSADGLILYAFDASFTKEILDSDTGNIIGYQSENPIQKEGPIAINFYPGYNVYLYADEPFGLTVDTLATIRSENLPYAIFGGRSKVDQYRYTRGIPPKYVTTHYSTIGTPISMLSRSVIPALRPQLPVGPSYTTRPDSYGKATYTFTTNFNHKPFAVQYSRAHEQDILNALYTPSTIDEIKTQLASFSKDEYANSRWKNVLSFDYNNREGVFERFPDTEDGYRFPNPDNILLFERINNAIAKYNQEENLTTPVTTINAGSLIPGAVVIPGTNGSEDVTLADYIKKAVLDVFVPLTEVPLVFDQIENRNSYQPVNKKQVIRDRNGNLLRPTDVAYAIAPMAKRIGNNNELQFTDFTLDGTTSHLYFYKVQECSNTMKIGEASPILGPVYVMNTNPLEAPQLRQVLSLSEPKLSVTFEFAPYPIEQQIVSIHLYRTSDRIKATSIRSMDLVKTIDLRLTEPLENSVLKITDTSEDLQQILYKIPVYYRVTIRNEVSYTIIEEGIDTLITKPVPSKASDLITIEISSTESNS